MKKLFYLVLLVLMSCSSGKVVYDYDNEIDFTKYSMFRIAPNAGLGFSELDQKRVEKALIDELSKKGIQKSTKAQFLIDYKSTLKKHRRNKSVRVGVGRGVRVSTGILLPRPNDTQIITLQFKNRKTKQLIWEGEIQVTVKDLDSPIEKQNFINDVIGKILNKYPPK